MIPKYIYGIYNATDREVIWSARGSAYKEPEAAEKKLKRLKRERPEKQFRVVVYKLEVY